jgi:DNA invertase Pin-like site-specific DNA recombinase
VAFNAFDSTTLAGKLLFHISGAFAEFERNMIRPRINAGLARARAQGKRLGRSKIDAKTEAAIRDALANGKQACSTSPRRSVSAAAPYSASRPVCGRTDDIQSASRTRA